jgi:hypothetical protein
MKFVFLITEEPWQCVLYIVRHKIQVKKNFVELHPIIRGFRSFYRCSEDRKLLINNRLESLNLFLYLKRCAVYFVPDGRIDANRSSWKVGYQNCSNSIINVSYSTNYSRTPGYEKSLWLVIEVFQEHTWTPERGDCNRWSAGFANTG